MPRSISSLAAIFLCSTALAGCETLSSINPFTSTAASDRVVLEKQVKQDLPYDVASGVRQSHDLRMAGD